MSPRNSKSLKTFPTTKNLHEQLYLGLLQSADGGDSFQKIQINVSSVKASPRQCLHEYTLCIHFFCNLKDFLRPRVKTPL